MGISDFLSRVHPYQWRNGLIARRNHAPLRSVLVPIALVGFGGLAAGVGWAYSTVLLRPARAVDVVALWPHGPEPDSVGLPFEDVLIDGPLGHYPAWIVPGERDTWVIAVHGRGADRREALRILPTLHALGLPTVVLTYRNDEEAPPSPDGYYHLGESEWADLAAAVRYARSRGARRVVLFGWSMGAAIVGAYLSSPERDLLPVAGVIWDSPVVDWRSVLRQQARLRRLPVWLADVACWWATARAGIHFDALDLVQHPPSARPPTLILHGAHDDAVLPGSSRDLAAVAGHLDWPVRYQEFDGAVHTAGWNADRAGYEAAVADFLTSEVLVEQPTR